MRRAELERMGRVVSDHREMLQRQAMSAGMPNTGDALPSLDEWAELDRLELDYRRQVAEFEAQRPLVSRVALSLRRTLCCAETP